MKKYATFGGTNPLPEGIDPASRFVRLAEHSRYLPEPKTYSEVMAGPLSLLRTAQVPFRDPSRVGGAGFWGAVQTNWITASDVTNRIYYVNGAAVPSLVWLDLKEVDFGEGGPLLFLDPHDPKVGGDARMHFPT